MKYELVFVVLTYKNHRDLINFTTSIKEKIHVKYKILVVNSFYDDITLLAIKNIAESTNCDFINIENKGYGYGNNRGVETAIKKYEFNFLIVSNPDIEIIEFDYSVLKNNLEAVYAPNIKTKNGKNQNPYYSKDLKVVHTLKYKGYSKNSKFFIYGAIIINKFFREIFLKSITFKKKTNKKIYASHGSFVIFGKRALEKLIPLYLEEMFLFSEEVYLAYRAKQKKVPIFYLPDIKILHQEDGSINLTNINLYDNAKDSYIVFSKFLEKDKRENKMK